jgi:hypothetical protein
MLADWASSCTAFVEFREKRDVDGARLEDALWLATMELQRLNTWVPTKRDMDAGSDDFDVKL